MSNDGDIDRSFFLIVENLLELLVSTKILSSDFMDFFFCGVAAQRGPWPPHS